MNETTASDASVGVDEFLGAAGSGALGLFSPEAAATLAEKLAATPAESAAALGFPVDPDDPSVGSAVFDAVYGMLEDAAAATAGEMFGAESRREAASRAAANMNDLFDAAQYDPREAGRALYDESVGDTYLMDRARADYYRS